MLGDRLTELSVQMASADLPLQLKPLDVLFAQRSSFLVGTMQEIARAKSKNLTVVVSLHLSGFFFSHFSNISLRAYCRSFLARFGGTRFACVVLCELACSLSEETRQRAAGVERVPAHCLSKLRLDEDGQQS
jgi:hypothetical protein